METPTSSEDEEMDEREEKRQRQRIMTLRRGAMVVPARGDEEPVERKQVIRKLAGRCNSEMDAVTVEHAEGVPLSHLRRNSCSCVACGGVKLARKYLSAFVPRGESHCQGLVLNSIKSLAALIRNYKKDDQSEMPGLTAIRLSVILKLHESPNLYAKPPETPRLHQLLQASPAVPAAHKERLSVQDFFARNAKWMAKYRVSGTLSRKGNTQRKTVQKCASLTLSTSAESTYKERISPFQTPKSTTFDPSFCSPQKLRPYRSAGKLTLPPKDRLVI